MASIGKTPYEISVWGDRKVYIINGEKRYTVTGEDKKDYLFDSNYMQEIQNEINKGFELADWDKVFKLAGYRDKKIADGLVSDPRWNLSRASIRYVFYYYYWQSQNEISSVGDRVLSETLRADFYYNTYWSKFEIVDDHTTNRPETGWVRMLTDEDPNSNYLPDYFKNFNNLSHYPWYTTGYEYKKEDNFSFQNGGYMNEIIKELNRKPIDWEQIFIYAGYRDKKIANKWAGLYNVDNKLYDELPRSSIRFVMYLYYMQNYGSGSIDWDGAYWNKFIIENYARGIISYTEYYNIETEETNEDFLYPYFEYNDVYKGAYANYAESANVSATTNYLSLIFDEIAAGGAINWPIVFKLAGLRDKKIHSGGIESNSSLSAFNIPRSSIRFVLYNYYLYNLEDIIAASEKSAWDAYLASFSVVDQQTGQIVMTQGYSPELNYFPNTVYFPSSLEKTWYNIGYDSSLIQNQYLEETKLAVIGNDEMDSPIRAFNPVLTEDLNGSHTLTFQIHYRFWDEASQSYQDNPFLKYLVNERKIKLFRAEEVRKINWEYIFKLAGYRDYKIYEDWLAYDENPTLIVYAKKRSSIRFVTYLWYEYTYGRITKDDVYWDSYWQYFDIVNRKTGQIESYLDGDDNDQNFILEILPELYQNAYATGYEADTTETTALTTNYMRKILDLAPQATDDDGWLDFVIKQIDEDTRTYTNTYTCKDLFINELGKTGYEIELEDDLQNNMGTIFELGDSILEGSDWHVDKEASDIISQTNKESLYRLVLPANIDATCMKTFKYKNKTYEKSSSLSLPIGSVIYVFYSCYSNREQELQFYYLKDSDLPYKTDSDGFIINSPNYKASIDALALFYKEEPEVSLYMGEKILTHQLTKYIPEIDETCYVYEQEGANIALERNYFDEIKIELNKSPVNWNKVFKLAGKRDKKIIGQNVSSAYRVPRASIRYVFTKWYDAQGIGSSQSTEDKYYTSYWATFEIVDDTTGAIRMIGDNKPEENYIPFEYVGDITYTYYLEGYALTSERYYCYETLEYPKNIDIENYLTNGVNFSSLDGWTGISKTQLQLNTVQTSENADYGYAVANSLNVRGNFNGTYGAVCNSGLYDNRALFSDRGFVEDDIFIFAIKYIAAAGSSFTAVDAKIGKVENNLDVCLNNNGTLNTSLISIFDFEEISSVDVPKGLDGYTVFKATCNRSISYNDLLQNYPILNFYITFNGTLDIIDVKFFPYKENIEEDIIDATNYMTRIQEEIKVNYNTNWQLIFRIAGKRDKKIAEDKTVRPEYKIPYSSLRYVFFHWYTAIKYGNIYDYDAGKFNINSTAQLLSIISNDEPTRSYWETFEILDDSTGKIKCNDPENNILPNSYLNFSYYNYYYLEEYNGEDTIIIPDNVNSLQVPYNFFNYHNDSNIPEDVYIQSLKTSYEEGFSYAKAQINNWKNLYVWEKYLYNITYYDSENIFIGRGRYDIAYSNSITKNSNGQIILDNPTNFSGIDYSILIRKYIVLDREATAAPTYYVNDVSSFFTLAYANIKRVLSLFTGFSTYVADANEEAYPNGGTRDGELGETYWYDRIGQIKTLLDDEKMTMRQILEIDGASLGIIETDWMKRVIDELDEYNTGDYFKLYKTDPLSVSVYHKGLLMGKRDRRIADGKVKDARWNIPRSSIRFLFYDNYYDNYSSATSYWEQFSVVDASTGQIAMNSGFDVEKNYFLTLNDPTEEASLESLYNQGYNFWNNLFENMGYRDAKLDFQKNPLVNSNTHTSYDSLNYIFNEWYFTTGQWGEETNISPDLKIKTIYNFFPDDYDLSVVNSKQDLQLSISQQNTSGFIPVYDPDYQKVTSINGSKSNRFNLIQNCCESFECWAKFRIKHNSKGQTNHYYKALDSYSDVVEGGRYYFKASNNTDLTDDRGFFIVENPIPADYYLYYKRLYDKTIIFKEYIGQDNFAGFRYGVNLSSIQRRNISDQIASKVIIQPNANEFAPNGSCTIQQAKLNPTGENFIYNFNYYINQGLLNKEEVYEDLYGYNNGLGLYPKLKEWNRVATTYIDAMATMIDGLTKLESQQQVYDALLTEAENNKNKIITELNSINYNIDDISEGGEYVEDLIRQRDSLVSTINYNKGLSEQNKSTFNEYQKDYQQISDNLDVILRSKRALINDFQNKYYAYLQEGTWTSEDYFDPDLYYDAANSVLYNSCFPQVSYTINVLELSKADGYSSYKFRIGDKSYIEDTEYFGWDSKGRPYQEEIVVSQIQSYLDDPSKNSLTIQNYKTQFQDLFQRIAAASQTLQYNEGIYSRAVGVINLEGSLNSKILEESLKNNELIVSNARAQSVTWGEDGITISSFVNPNEIVRLTSLGIAVSSDGGKNWTTGITGHGINADVITTGRLDTNQIRIFNRNQQTFEWNSNGISAFEFDSSGHVSFGNYVRFNQFGLFGYRYIPGSSTYGIDWEPTTVDEVVSGEGTIFSLTWKGLSINLPIQKNGDPVLRIGSPSNPVFEIASDGRVTIRGGLQIQQYNGSDYVDVLNLINDMDAALDPNAIKLNFIAIVKSEDYNNFGIGEREDGKLDYHFTNENYDVCLQLNGNTSPNPPSVAFIATTKINNDTAYTKFYATYGNIGMERRHNGSVASSTFEWTPLRVVTDVISGEGGVTPTYKWVRVFSAPND